MTAERHEPLASAEIAARVSALRAALQPVIVGQTDPVDEVLAALLAGGHVLLEGLPGLAKTLLARSLAQALGLEFRRIQFTPDLMPTDVVGANIFDFGRGVFSLQKGPIFTQVLLADEINRTPPKTQAALLEAMEERQVTIDGVSHALDQPFFVIGTQNPIEHEGTYPLPEAQLDRFLMKVTIGYPAPDDEREVYRRFLDGRLRLSSAPEPIPRVLTPGDLPRMRQSLLGIHVETPIVDYLLALVQATRVSPSLSGGASPRAGLALLAASRAWAAMEGRNFVIPDDVKRMAPPVLRHRLLPTPDAELEGRGAVETLAEILKQVPVPA